MYSGYHSNDYSLYRFELGEFERDAHFEPMAMRDYRSIFDGPKLSDQFQTATYRGAQRLALHPDFYRSAPTFVGNEFGLNQASGGLQFTTGDMFGGQELTAWGVVGKNMRNATDLNTDVGFFYERRLRPQVGKQSDFQPPRFSSRAGGREIDNLFKESPDRGRYTRGGQYLSGPQSIRSPACSSRPPSNTSIRALVATICSRPPWGNSPWASMCR